MESSRIFVRGLPPRFTDDDVRKHFAKFPVTDVKFFPHRRIGYVGYKTPEDAAKAVKYFNKTFINLTKIYVESARPVSMLDRFAWRLCADRLTRSQTRSCPSRGGSRD
jgi:multiple RNA-binding domain-containing protein 1